MRHHRADDTSDPNHRPRAWVPVPRDTDDNYRYDFDDDFDDDFDGGYPHDEPDIALHWPNGIPGSAQATGQGCLCPIFANHPRVGLDLLIAPDCPVHCHHR